MGVSRLYHPREFACVSGNVWAAGGSIAHPTSHAPTASESQALIELLSYGPTLDNVQSSIYTKGQDWQAAALAERFTVEAITTYGRI